MMSNTLIVRLGRFAPVGPAIAVAVFGAMTYAVLVLDTSEVIDGTNWAAAWLPLLLSAISAMVLLRRLWLMSVGRAEAVLSREGLRARCCDNVLVPWDMVRSVTVEGEAAVASPGLNASGALLEHASRHDSYAVVLDPKVLELGVKHSENLASMGFKLVPLKLSVSSGELAEAFLRYLPPERCIGFGGVAAPATARDLTRRAAEGLAGAALGGLERMEVEQAAPVLAAGDGAPGPDAADDDDDDSSDGGDAD
jgi:hypothetical protein